MDSKLHCGPIEIWGSKPGAKKRVRHALRAMSDFNSVVDVVVVSGVPGEGVTDAVPWFSKERKGLTWHITALDDETGHIRLEAWKP